MSKQDEMRQNPEVVGQNEMYALILWDEEIDEARVHRKVGMFRKYSELDEVMETVQEEEEALLSYTVIKFEVYPEEVELVERLIQASYEVSDLDLIARVVLTAFRRVR